LVASEGEKILAMTRKMEEGKVCNDEKNGIGKVRNDEEMEGEMSAMKGKWKGVNRQRW